jgi:Domain of unknown function (DUF6265)
MKRIQLNGMICCALLACVACAASWTEPAKAQNTPANTAKPSLSEFTWLEGKWEGNWGPRLAEQVWLSPKGGELPGLFRVVENDKPLVLELFSIIESSDGIEMRIRHFTPSLAPWEQSAIAILRLTNMEGTSAVFENTSGGQPNRQTLIRVDTDTYTARTEISQGADNRQVTEIRFHRVKAPAENVVPEKKKSKSR